jgi:tRNA pseudouridine55 synthase
MVARRSGHDGPDGLVIVDKPAGWTSHDVVAKSRGLLGTRKVGHAGTLDPDATGVLLLGVGRATKLLRYLSPLGKSYVGTFALGVVTSTQDSSGEVIAVFDQSDIGLDAVRAAATAFVGQIEQVPPMVSAVKVGGRRLHELAREGKEVERAARSVTITSLVISEPDSTLGPRIGGEPTAEWLAAARGGLGASFAMAVTCSSGTYVRTLAHDLGAALGRGAHLSALRRTAVGPFRIDEAVPLEQVGPDAMRPMSDVVRHLTSVTVDEALAAAVAVGKVLEQTDLGTSGEGPWAVNGPDGALLAVYEPFRGSTVKPAVVLAPASS